MKTLNLGIFPALMLILLLAHNDRASSQSSSFSLINTSGDTLLYVGDDGFVGIGTTVRDEFALAPTLEVVGNISLDRIVFSDGSGSVSTVGLNGPDLVLHSDDNNVVIIAEGSVGIGTESPGHPLEMGSGAHVTSGGVWTNASPREYWENIRDLTVEEAMIAFHALRPKRFNHKVDKQEEHVGFIAEEVPDLVATADRRGLSPMDVVAVLTKIVQQQQEKIEELEARLNDVQ